MNKKIILSILLLCNISIFAGPALAEPDSPDNSCFIVVPNRYYGIAVDVIFSDTVQSPLVVVAVEESEGPQIIEFGFNDRAGIIFTWPTPLGYDAKPNTKYVVMVNVLFDDYQLLGAVSIETNEYGTVSVPIIADLVSSP